MELLKSLTTCFLLVLPVFEGVLSLNLLPSMSAEKAVFGNNTFTLTCQYTLAAGDDVFFIQLTRQRPGSSTEDNIVIFRPNQNVFTIQDTTLEQRTNVTMLGSNSNTVSVQFNDIMCSDRGTYKWEASFFDGATLGTNNTEKSVTMIVKAVTTFKDLVPPSYTPSTSLKEGDDVTFTCTGDVGAEPRGTYKWSYFLVGSSSTDVTSSSSSETPIFNDTSCSWTQTSSVTLKLLREFNGVTVRCEVQQEQVNKYRQTSQINVQYGPVNLQINAEPSQPTYYIGDQSLNLTCMADANPGASYYWVVPDGNSTRMVQGATYQLTNLALDMTGEYTCVAYNTINLVNYTTNNTFNLDVRVTTTTTTTTTTTPSSTEPSNGGGGNTGGSKDDDDGSGGTDIGLIVGLVVAAVVLIVIIIVVVLCLKKRGRKPEIEEPPEKPRNNQDLTFYGNRPDLVTSDLKNNQHNLNTSFSNSYDSSSDIKPREDGLNYIDLQFDDRPRSRRPIQLIDNNGSTPYADINLPQV